MAAVNEKNRLNMLSEQTKDRLNRASKLTTGNITKRTDWWFDTFSGLADEAVRWAQTVSAIKLGIDNLIGDIFIASASVSYAGPFTGVFR